MCLEVKEYCFVVVLDVDVEMVGELFVYFVVLCE